MADNELHFEKTWVEAEALVAKEVAQKSVRSIIMEATTMLGLYEAIDGNEKVPIEEKPAMKTQIFGKLLMICAQLSLKDNVNVFGAMQTILEEDRIEHFKSKYERGTDGQ